MFNMIVRAWLLMRLQALSFRLKYLQHRLATLPRHIDVTESEARLLHEKLAYMDFVQFDLEQRASADERALTTAGQ